MDLFQRILHDIQKKNADAEAKGLPSPKNPRVPSLAEKEASWQPLGSGLLFCTHGRPWIDVCPSCKRTRKEAELQRQRFLKNYATSDNR